MKETSLHAPRVAVRSVGCKLNQQEALRLLGEFEERGFVRAESGCDLCVVNTCTVTSRADRKSRNLLLGLRRENPGAKFVVTGCYATTDPEKIRDACPGADIVPNADKDRIPGVSCERWFPGLSGNPRPDACGVLSGRSRPFIKIQDGCDLRCSYCKVWIARGPSRSVPSSLVIGQARLLAESGFSEAVLTGINITDYREGRDGLAGLLKKLLAERLPLRYRLASLEPQRVDEELLEAVSDPAVCDHFHLSLQSGSDLLLGKMNRAYSAARFADTVLRLKKIRPEAGIGADVIVGFPGETDSLFGETKSLIRSLAIPFLHVFGYSDRPGTPAVSLPGKVADRTKSGRRRSLVALGGELELDFRRRFLGRTLEIVVEKNRGLSSNYIGVRLPGPAGEMRRRLVRVRVTAVKAASTEAEID